MPKIIDHKKRQATILAHAFQAFSQKGFLKTTLADIAEISKISRQTLYQYFTDKNQILFFAIRNFIEAFIDQYIIIANNKNMTIRERIYNIGQSLLKDALDKRDKLIKFSEYLLQLEQSNSDNININTIINHRAKKFLIILENLLNLAIEKELVYPHLCSKEKIPLMLDYITSYFIASVVKISIAMPYNEALTIEDLIKQFDSTLDLIFIQE